MKSFFERIKTYPITAVSLVLIICGLITLVLIHGKGAEFKSEMLKRQSDIKTLENFLRTSRKVPSQKPDAPPRTLTLAINRIAIDKIQEAYNKMGKEATDIFALAVLFNHHAVRHLPMDDGLLPKPSNATKPYEARNKYRKAFEEMLLEFSQNYTYPRLNAGEPVRGEQVQRALMDVESNFRNSIFPARELTDSEYEKLAQLKQDKIVDVLKRHAESIHVYAKRDESSSEYPFDVGEWSRGSGSPDPEVIWEGQMGLWIQQDIVAAIATANKVDDPSSNVSMAPVKRLIKIRVLPAYVGVDGGGALSSAPKLGPTQEEKADQPMPDDFSIAHTGRRSNAIYDVRHAIVEVVVDFQRLPEFIEVLSKVNFITVLKLDIEQVDEYEAMKEGYFYGAGDAVQVKMVIESIWLREWTKEYMPQKVKEHLGLVPKPEKS